MFADCDIIGRVGIRRPPALSVAGFRMPLAEPGVRLSIRTGLSLDVHA